MKPSARRYQIALFGLLSALLCLTSFAHRRATATRGGNSSAALATATTGKPAQHAAHATAFAPAQSGGIFTLGKANVTSGSETSAGGAFSLFGAAGQFTADLLTGGLFSIGGGLFGGGATQCPAITITPTTLPNATLGLNYTAVLTASGGTGPYTFAFTSQTVPPHDVRLLNDGTFTGAPTQTGSFPFTVGVTDANGCTGSRDYTLVVGIGCTPPQINPASLPNATQGSSYSQTLTSSSGSGSFSLTAGALPNGLTLNATSGLLSGTPGQAGSFSFTVSVTDAGCTGQRGYTLVVNAAACGGAFAQQAQLVGSDSQAVDVFGEAVALSGDTAIVGALQANANHGAAYIFVRNNGVWTEEAELLAPDGMAGDKFGTSVALSGDTAIVGAFVGDAAVADTGAAYVFERNSGRWSLQQKLSAPDGAFGDGFGYAVAFSGETVAIGAPVRRATYIFTRSGGSWTHQQTLTANDSVSGDEFGGAIALDTDTVVVGARAGGAGAAYVFTRSGALWSPALKLSAPDGVIGDEFGFSVALSGNTALLGARLAATSAGAGTGAAYLFTRTSPSAWAYQGKLTAADAAANDQFGFAVTLENDSALVGAVSASGPTGVDVGAAYLFMRNGASWNQTQKLTTPDVSHGDFFGRAVALNNNTALIGVPSGRIAGTSATGTAFVFARACTPPTLGVINLQAIGNEGFVALNWTHSGFGTINGFKLYRAASSSGPFSLLNGALAAGAASFNDSSVTPNTAYFYKVSVVDASNAESAYSNVAAATPVDVVPPVIAHTPVTATVPPNLAVPISATVTDNTAVQSVKLFFRTTGAGGYSERLMTASGNLYSSTINANEVVAPGVDYYIEARDAASVVRAGQADNPYHFDVVDRPFIDSLAPLVGSAAGGTTVILTGRNFKAGAVVRFDQAIATVTSVSAAQIVCTTPPHFPALVDVRVTNPDGASDARLSAFTYQAASTLSLPTLSGARNVRVQIPINANVSGLTAADVRITFNNAVLNAVTAQLGTLVANWSLQVNNATPGEVRLALASSSGPVTGAGTLAVLEFDVPGAAGSSSPLTFDGVSLNGGALSVTTANGVFNVLPEYAISGTVRQWQTNAGLPNVQLALTGARNYNAATNAGGAFTLSNVLGGAYTLTPSKTDGAAGISALDASLILQHSAGLITLTGNQLTAADADRSGAVNSQDAFYGLQYAVGLLGLPFPGADRIWDFSPATRSYANLNTNQTNQDFAAVLLGDVNGSFTGGNQPSTLATLALPTVTVPNGAEFLLPLTLSLPSGSLYGAELRISYDPALLQVLAVEASSPTNNWLRAANLNMPGLLRVALAGTQGFTGSGELLRLRLRAHGAAGAASAVTITHASLNEGSFGTTLTAGRVTLRKRAVKADFDVDGQTDLAVWRGVTGDWLIQRSGNQTLQTVAWGTSNDPYNDVVASGDYDGDGKADVAVWRPSDGGWYIRQSSNGATVAQLWGTRGDVPVAEDYDGDGKADLAVWRPSDGTWYVLRSSDGSYLIEAWGMAGDMPVVGDYDGDGKADLAVWRPGDGYWYLKLSTGGTQVTAWGAGYAPYFDTPVPADYDGDGKTDLAIWRGADNLWYIRQSSDGQPLIRRWGANYAPYHDVPTPGDYDGDGKADIAVWRPADGTWYVWRSGNGTFLIQQHGQPGDTPIPASRHNR